MDINWDEVEKLGGHDMSLSEVCLIMDLSERQVERFTNIKAEMAKVIRRGKAKKALLVATALLNQCEKGTVTAIIWYEKTRRGLAEGARVENEFESAAAAASEKLARAIARLADAQETKSARDSAAEGSPFDAV